MTDNKNSSGGGSSSSISSGDDSTNERPQDWEMLSLSLGSLTDHPKSSTEVAASIHADADADVTSLSTGGDHSEKEPQGIPDDQVHSKYFGLASSSLSEKTEGAAMLLKQEAPKTDASSVSANDAVLEGLGVCSEVDWMEPSPVVIASPIDSGEFGTSEVISTQLESSPPKNLNEQQQSIEREVLAETDYAFSEAFEEVYGEARAADVDSADKPLVESSNSKSKARKTWWRQQMEAFGVHVSQAGALWSIALAATVMGLVILGRRWHNERSQNHQLRLQLGLKDEKINQLVFQISRLKDAVDGRRRVPITRS